ncbi:MAG TPA: radical SAM protein [Opitutaceae bacterium]|nr:radical SAM protein [Opitutaceae bacterium]
MFVVTKRCHSKCVYCDIWKAKDSPGGLDGELTLEEIRRVAAANPFFQWIDFTGGEPTDHPNFAEVVQTFAETCKDLLLVHFPTNGIATKRIHSVVTQLKRTIRPRLVVTVSIDGPSELNDRLRGIRNDFSHAVDTFCAVRRELGADNVFVGLTLHAFSKTSSITSTQLVQETYSAVNRALIERGEDPIAWSSLHLNIPHLSQHYYGNTAPKQDSEFGGKDHRKEIADALRYAANQCTGTGSIPMRVIERIYRSEAMGYLSQGRTNIPCSALLSTAYLSEKGEVYPCTIWNRPLGNVRSSNFRLMPIIEQARSAGVRKAITKQNCPNCWTPCEAYPAIAAAPFRSMVSLVRGT